MNGTPIEEAAQIRRRLTRAGSKAPLTLGVEEGKELAAERGRGLQLGYTAKNTEEVKELAAARNHTWQREMAMLVFEAPGVHGICAVRPFMWMLGCASGGAPRG